jgi:hypothetical protein
MTHLESNIPIAPAYGVYISQEKFEDTKGVVRSRKSEKGREYNRQKIKDKGKNNYPQNSTQKT